MAANETTPVEPPIQLSASPAGRLARDVVAEFRADRPWPPGPKNFSLARTNQITTDPLPLLLSLYEEYGPIFSARLLHQMAVFMIGPEANHFMTVGHPELFEWRQGSLGDLIPLIGDGLLTIDGDYHDRARAIVLPAFHREQVENAVEAMVAESVPAIDELRPGEIVDIYAWARRLAMRIAMRALLGLDPDDSGSGAAAARAFEGALSFYGLIPGKRLLRGPGSPWRKLVRNRAILDEIVYAEMNRRRAAPDPGRRDVLSMLLEARDSEGGGFSDGEVRDQLVTLMFAGHDTTTSTLTFLVWELAQHPDVHARVLAEQDEVLSGETPNAAQLEELPYMEMVLDETLRLYPAAWIGPRRAVEAFEFGGHGVPAGAYVHYCSWASHRLPEVFPEPEAFVPERFTRERKAALPRGAYIPFGGGRRICIGKRFGQTEIKLIATMLNQRLRLEALPGRTMRVRQMPTLGPAGGLPMRVRGRGAPASG
jgi:cytochrome P450